MKMLSDAQPMFLNESRVVYLKKLKLKKIAIAIN